MSAAYFETPDGKWFEPTGYARGPWDVDACHAGPPTALIARAMERLVPAKRLARISVELIRPIPMSGFWVQAEVRRPGRSATFSGAEIFDEDRVFARAYGMHLRLLDDLDCSTASHDTPDFTAATPGPFPISELRMTHTERAFPSSIEVRYDPSASHGNGGPTIVWMRTIVPILADEEPSGFQRICPLADSGNGLSYNDYLDKILFVNTDLTVSLIRDPSGDWLGSRAVSHWQRDGTGLADAELFDRSGPLGRAAQSLLLMPAGG